MSTIIATRVHQLPAGRYGFLYELGDDSGFLGPCDTPRAAFEALAGLYGCPAGPVELLDPDELHPLEAAGLDAIADPRLRNLGAIVLGQLQGPFNAACVGMTAATAWKRVERTVRDWLEERAASFGVSADGVPVLAWLAAPPNQSQYFYLVRWTSSGEPR